MARFRDRRDAGFQLAAELRALALPRPIVLSLPRGGVPVGYEVARRLRAPLDVWGVRKVRVPWHPELGMGAVAEGGHVYLSPRITRHVGLSRAELDALAEEQRLEVEARLRRFRRDRARPDLRERSVILVDDGIATGATVRAAIGSIRRRGPDQIVLAVPVAAADTVEMLTPSVDRVVCLAVPRELYAVGFWYQDFEQVPDDDVSSLLEEARRELPEGQPTHAQVGSAS